MLEAKLEQAELLKKILDAVKELVTDANFDCSDEGIKLQAMDNSHVALVSLNLAKTGFSEYRCDRDMSLGVSLASLQKIVKCAGNNDILTLRADESVDVLALLFEAKHADRVGEYEMKLMDIDQEHLGIPDTVYDAEIDLPATEFARIIRDLKELGESVKIEVSKEGVRFSADGDIGTASVTLKPTDKRGRKADSDGEDSDEEQEQEDEEDEEAEEPEPKEEEDEDGDVKPKISGSDDEDDDAPAKSKAGKKRKAVEDSEEEEGADENGEEASSPKRVKKESGKAKPAKKEKKKAAPKKGKASSSSSSKAKSSKGKKAKGGDEEKSMDVRINLQQAVALTFSIKYLSNFAKSTPLAERVHLHMSNEVPLLVEYAFEQGHIRYYLAPKLTDE